MPGHAKSPTHRKKSQRLEKGSPSPPRGSPPAHRGVAGAADALGADAAGDRREDAGAKVESDDLFQCSPDRYALV